MPINDTIAKYLSKLLRGIKGTIVHFFIMSVIYGAIGKGICFLITVFGKDISIARRKEIESLVRNKGHKIFEIPELRTYAIIFFSVYVVVFLLTLIGTIRAKKIYKRAAGNKYQTFGKARFSELDEVLKQGLKGPGIVLGKIKSKLITKPPSVEGHTLVVGGTGTGKSRGVVIPSLLLWEGSTVVIDIKGEISKITKEVRKRKGNMVYVFNPESENGDCYDPIKLCGTVDAAQELARTLIPIPEKGETFWVQSAQAILSAFVFEGALKGYKLSDIAEKICTTPINDLVNYCRNHETREVRLLCSIAYDMPEKTLGGVMSELKSKLITIATDKNIRRSTRKSDWTPESLEKGASIYLRVSEHMLEQYRDLWTVIINQILRHLSEREERKNPPILIALDELPRLGEIKGLTSALATLRSRNVHILSIIQSMAQLDEVYNENQRKIIADNCRFKLVLSATDPETQKYFSDLAGQRTAMARGVTIGAGFVPNMSKHEQGTQLIRPEEWANLEKPVLFAPKLDPVRVKLAFWDKENFV
ncbi:type IV secretory system conjugative DNA transfer family protein [Clostridium sp. KNHs214]|uniref:type IV secretory system conjugative DNA transfer family protein n=1 Tax=Clostridium sp. KNHs214 TaxID=1540257 RepID=UPI000557EF6F|nr:type IV secretory system conjugative DNA transfer family protein [Clostridium sp. KNHs214]